MNARLDAIPVQLERFPLSIIQLAMRIAVGAVFFRSGLLKVDSWEFVYPNAWGDHLLWGSILVFLLTRGPGAISVDEVIAKLWSRRATTEAAAPSRP
jgi:uncharacterized membrane protein YphA (DoxX/SURF4 family)